VNGGADRADRGNDEDGMSGFPHREHAEGRDRTSDERMYEFGEIGAQGYAERSRDRQPDGGASRSTRSRCCPANHQSP
jgi:hypothetical protein